MIKAVSERCYHAVIPYSYTGHKVDKAVLHKKNNFHFPGKSNVRISLMLIYSELLVHVSNLANMM